MTRSFVLHLDLKQPDAPDPDWALAETVSLTAAIDLSPMDADIAVVSKPNPATLIGPGKVEELGVRFEAQEIDLV
ncbi:MAG: GTPase HflX, partial [Pseudomonadota bacterium]